MGHLCTRLAFTTKLRVDQSMLQLLSDDESLAFSTRFSGAVAMWQACDCRSRL